MFGASGAIGLGLIGELIEAYCAIPRHLSSSTRVLWCTGAPVPALGMSAAMSRVGSCARNDIRCRIVCASVHACDGRPRDVRVSDARPGAPGGFLRRPAPRDTLRPLDTFMHKSAPDHTRKRLPSAELLHPPRAHARENSASK
jgi:hypothetical protein